jgi:hypothetical protein
MPERLFLSSLKGKQRVGLSRKLFFIIFLPLIGEANKVSAKPDVIGLQQVQPTVTGNSSESQLLLLGLIINGKVVVESIRVRGREDGEKAVNFDGWLVPLEDLKKPLKLEISRLPGGEIEVSAPTIKGKYRLTNTITDNQLGTVISIADLRAIVGVPVTFDVYKYGLVIDFPEEAIRRRPQVIEPVPVTEGLPVISPPAISLHAIEQRVNTNGGEGRDTNTNGELRAVGNILDTSWSVRLEQPTLDHTQTWNIAEASIIRQQPRSDIIAGSQIPFWRRRGGGESYWGLTYIERQGFVPPTQDFGSDFLVTDRLQSRRVGRSISGQAAPGSIVRLVRGGSQDALDEVLVNSSGIFRFDNVVVSSSGQDTFGQDYQLLIYPKGELLNNPEIRLPQFTTTPGQLPQGASAWVASGGANRVTSGTFGDFNEYRGGALYRRGLSESLTVGLGVAHDRGVLGVGEVFWQPNNLPLEVALFTAAGTNTDFVGRLSYRPSSDFYVNANSDNTSTRTNARWRLNPNFSALGEYDTLRGARVGVEYIANSINSSTFATATIDDQARTAVSVNQRLDRWQASLLRNESNLVGQVAYQLTDAPSSQYGHRLIAGYQLSQQSEASNQPINDSLTSLTWQYRSPDLTSYGTSAWQLEAGYNWGSSGSGISAGVNLDLIPGWRLQGNYRGIRENSNQSDFSVSLATTLLFDGGARGTRNQISDLRTVGRIEATAFFDSNQNGRQDRGEKNYWDPLLLRINQNSLSFYRTQVEGQTGVITLPPNSYRVDIDPSGYPPNYRSKIESQRMDVVASGTTRIAIPLTPSYTVTGVLKDQNGNLVADTRVELVSADGKVVIDSVTNSAGLFYLESLGQGQYKFKIGEFLVSPGDLKIDSTTNPLQEVNLTVQLSSPSSQPKSQNREKTPPTLHLCPLLKSSGIFPQSESIEISDVFSISFDDSAVQRPSGLFRANPQMEQLLNSGYVLAK